MSFVPYQLLDKPMYHMCVKAEWEQATASGKAYFPPTFVQDGRKTHASMHVDKLLGTANHFYKTKSPSSVEWICLELHPQSLLETVGMVTLVEPPLPVGSTAAETSSTSNTIKFPHIYGGIPTTIPGVVTRVFPMTRNISDGTFLDIPGLLLAS